MYSRKLLSPRIKISPDGPPRMVVPNDPTKRVERGESRSRSAEKTKAAFAVNDCNRFRPSKTGIVLFTDCDSEQEPQPRNLSCKISTRFRRASYATCILHTNEGHDIQRQRIL